MSQQTATRLLSDVDRTRRRLYALLRSTDARLLARRPASGDWSIIENVRHLVFAEQVHLGEFLPDGLAWSPMRMSPRAERRFAAQGGVVVVRREGRQLSAAYDGTERRDDLEDALLAWDLIHQPIRKAVKAEGEAAAYKLERHLKHLVRHVEVIEKLVARARRSS